MSSNLTEPEGKPEPQAWMKEAAADIYWNKPKESAVSWCNINDLAAIIAKHYSSSLSFRDGWDAAREAAKKLAVASVLPEPSSDFHEGWNAATEMLKADIRALEPPTEKKGKE